MKNARQFRDGDLVIYFGTEHEKALGRVGRIVRFLGQVAALFEGIFGNIHKVRFGNAAHLMHEDCLAFGVSSNTDPAAAPIRQTVAEPSCSCSFVGLGHDPGCGFRSRYP